MNTFSRIINPLHWNRSLAVCVGCTLGISGFVLGNQIVVYRAEQMAIRDERTPSPADLRTVLYEIGYLPEYLAATGVQVEQIEPLIDAVVEAIKDDHRSINILSQLQSTVGVQAQAMQRKIRAGQASSEEIIAYRQQQKRDVKKVDDIRESFLRSLRDAGEAVLTAKQVETIEILQVNEQWSNNVPIEYRVVRRTESEWMRLQNAIMLQRHSDETGQPLQPELLAVVASAKVSKNRRSMGVGNENLIQIQKTFERSVRNK